MKTLKELYLKARIKLALYSVRRSYHIQLQKDLMIYGRSCEETFKPTLWQKIVRRLKRLPINKRRIHPMEMNKP